MTPLGPVLEAYTRSRDLSAARRAIVWREVPVPVRRFVEDPAYLNLAGKVYPRILDLLELVETEGVTDAYVNIGKGGGKTTAAWIFLAYGLYLWECAADPYATWSMIEGDKVCVVNLSTGQKNAKTLIWNSLLKGLARSPWFKGKYRAETWQLDFPSGLLAICGHSSAKAFEGLNVWRGVLDEANKLKDDNDRVCADELTEMLQTQARPRFPITSGAPGHYKVLAVSSSVHQGDFLSRAMAPVIEKGSFVPGPSPVERPPSVVRDRAPVDDEAFPQGQWRRGSEIAVIGPTWLFNPKSSFASFADVFARRATAAATAFGCKPPAAGEEAYVSNPELAKTGANPKRQHPILPNGTLAPWFKPYAGFSYFMHFDLSQKRDRTGIALGHHDGRSRVCIDLMLAHDPKEVGEIQIARVRQICYALRDRGFRIKKITYDGWQSVESIQTLKAHGFEVENFSVDKTTEAYDTWLEFFQTGNLDFYWYEPFYDDVRSLVLVNGRKVDHTSDGGKDVSDAVAAVTFHCASAGTMKPFIY